MNSACEPELLCAYVDGELTPAQELRIEGHVLQCDICQREVRMLEETSQAIQSQNYEELTDAELSRLHQAVDAASREQSVWRLGLVLGALAASLLVICSTWLAELPRPGSWGHRSPGLMMPSWERVAMDLRAESSFPVNDSVQVADAEFTSWMVDGLAGK